ncbi:MAG TPA: TMEM175 family protein [Pyrinomonadaceae bacterium]|nr:TMEM175 family protein [Pyrinomonadaceae bacterium]
MTKRERPVKNGFRLRGLGEVSRIEALSDGVIGFAITLLVVSLEVPRTFDDLMATARGFLAFAITFTLLFHVWHTQYRFFRRYGLNDNFVIWMTACLLFVVLFYVYPLKFIWTLLVNMALGIGNTVTLADGSVVPAVRREQMPAVTALFAAGFTAVFAVFTLLYAHAYRRRAALEMNELETHDTRTMIQDSALNVCIGLLSIAVALLSSPRHAFLAGMVFWLIGPVQYLNGYLMGRRRKRLESRFDLASGEPLSA